MRIHFEVTLEIDSTPRPRVAFSARQIGLAALAVAVLDLVTPG
jgi:hypothetical protein